jgi:hypothetical protein
MLPRESDYAEPTNSSITGAFLDYCLPGCAMADRCGVTSASDVRRGLLLVAMGLEAGTSIWKDPARRFYQSA